MLTGCTVCTDQTVRSVNCSYLITVRDSPVLLKMTEQFFRNLGNVFATGFS